MKKSILLFIAISFILSACQFNEQSIIKTLESSHLKIEINNYGEISSLIDIKTNKDYLVKDTIKSLMSIKQNEKILYPLNANIINDTIVLEFENNIQANVLAIAKQSHIIFELISVSNGENIELIIWGPFPTSINKVIGETIGVAQGEEFAIGLQALNPKTLGGYPWLNNDCMPQIDIFDQTDLSDMKEEGKNYVLYRVEAAKPTHSGSSLQAYCRNRDTERVVENLQHTHYTTPIFDDGGIIGSKIALFGCPIEETLKTIGEIEIAENLPHPMINGEWGKTAAQASSAYLIMDFGESDIEKAISYTKKAGLNYLYHSGPFTNWGHFDLKKSPFPNGEESMKNCVDQAEKEGITLGVHTLSNFITPNDPYVSPVPDERLAAIGSSQLSLEINSEQTTIEIESPIFFNQFKNNHLKTVKIGKELIRYGSISEKGPWQLFDCQRGAYDTKAMSHEKGVKISKLIDHGYKVFLSNTDLSIEIAENLAEIYNNTGLRQISFDGIEGNRSTGMGNYGEILFANAWYDKLDENIKSHFIADASRTSHYFWHLYTRMNWGEPWYAGFRESQSEYRFKNQAYFDRNLMPNMLGWFLMSPETSIEDIEWLLAKSAAFNAGYAFVANYQSFEKNGNTDTILHLIGEWEKIRINKYFTQDQIKKMGDLDKEFKLRTVNDTEWQLKEVYSTKFKHLKKTRQPGEPLYSTFDFQHLGKEQTLHFIIQAINCKANGIILEKDNYKKIEFSVSLEPGYIIKYTGGNKAVVYNKNWQKVSDFPINPEDFQIKEGKHQMLMDCQFSDAGKDAMLKMECRSFAIPELVKAK